MKPIKVIVLVLAFVTAGVTARSVYAACGGLPWDGSNPHTTGCDANASTICSAPLCDAWGQICGGKVELRFSHTCKTAWSRMTGGFPGGWAETRIHRNQDGCTYTHFGFFTAGYSAQLYDGAGWSAFAHAFTQDATATVSEDGNTCSF